MYLINARQDGINGNAFAKTERVYNLSEGMQLKLIDEAKLFKRIEQKNILVLIHGFISSIADVLIFYRTLEQQYREFFAGQYDAIVGYVWPGGESEFGYFQAKRNAQEAGNRFRYWMAGFSDAKCTIDLMGHSMASIVGYHCLQAEKDLSIRNIFSFGAAIPKDMVRENSDSAAVLEQVQHIYIFYTRNDHILKYWFRLVEWREAVGYSGFEDRDETEFQMDKLSLIDCSEAVSHHTGYRSSNILFEFIGKLLSGRHYPQDYSLQPEVSNQFDEVVSSRPFNPQRMLTCK